MTQHLVVREVVPAPAAAVFALVHDYARRLEWDTLLRRAETVDGAAPAKGVVAVCAAHWWLGGLTFRTRYVSFSPPTLAGVHLVGTSFVFTTWAASIRHTDRPDGCSEVVYTLTFRCRPRWAAPVIERVAAAGFRRETQRRLRALRRWFAGPDQRVTAGLRS